MGVSEYSNTRLYAAVIGLALGGYSLYTATTGRMTAAAWVVALAGAVAALHGIALLTPIAAHLGGASGPLMLLYALVILGAQLVVWSVSALTRDAMRAYGVGPEPALTGLDEGMVALALVMLASGLITTVRGGGNAGRM